MYTLLFLSFLSKWKSFSTKKKKKIQCTYIVGMYCENSIKKILWISSTNLLHPTHLQTVYSKNDQWLLYRDMWHIFMLFALHTSCTVYCTHHMWHSALLFSLPCTHTLCKTRSCSYLCCVLSVYSVSVLLTGFKFLVRV